MNKEDQFKNKYLNLRARLKQKGYVVQEVDSRTLRDYAGMNYHAAKAMGYPLERKNVMQLDNGMNWEDKYKTLVHEINEYRLMNQGKTYWQAHTQALKDEFTVGGIP